MTSHKKAISTMLLLILCAILTSCQPEQAADSGAGSEEVTIKIAYGDSYSTILFHAMMLSGSLEEAMPDNVTVSWEHLPSSTTMRESLVSGAADFAAYSIPAFITGEENDLPIMLLANMLFPTTGIYTSRSDISSMDDITSADRISILAKGSANNLSLGAFAKEEYNDIRKFEQNLQILDLPETFALMASSEELAGALLMFPQYLQAEQIEGFKRVVDLTPYFRKSGAGVSLMGREGFCEEHPELVKIVFDEVKETIDFFNESPAEAAKILDGYYEGIDAEAIENEIKSSPLQLEISESAYNNSADLMLELGMLSKPAKKFSELPNYDTIPKVD